jgi:uncharacterized membrane protein
LLIKDLIPQAFGVKDYVYLTETNIKKGTAFRTYKGNLLIYTSPNSFLNKNKGKIYNNGGSEIFK